ncbi:MAG: hypothetical protein E6R04_07275 [Spirochaetes bacterium]|nr:MAG: hypothetical protein E6R04_07275 [Spirochaetota bacterium]
MKVQKQLIVSPETCDLLPTAYGDRMGYVDCPFCEYRNEIVSQNKRIVLGDACEHAKGAVDAGEMKVAIHFEEER